MGQSAEPLRIAIVLGSTRPGRRADLVGDWVLHQAVRREHAKFELVDLADYDLPLLDEPDPAIHGTYTRPHTRAWAERVAGFDGYLFVVPEYNRSIPAALKNALDYLYAEWGDKAAGIVSYGVDAGGARAAEHLRGVLGELSVADVRATVALSLMTEFADGAVAAPPHQSQKLEMLLDQLLSWSRALRGVREGRR
jgi:NAD(P)H-dependent FMN reductase